MDRIKDSVSKRGRGGGASILGSVSHPASQASQREDIATSQRERSHVLHVQISKTSSLLDSWGKTRQTAWTRVQHIHIESWVYLKPVPPSLSLSNEVQLILNAIYKTGTSYK